MQYTLGRTVKRITEQVSIELVDGLHPLLYVSGCSGSSYKCRVGFQWLIENSTVKRLYNPPQFTAISV
jgi:hypothetical protein